MFRRGANVHRETLIRAFSLISKNASPANL